MRLVERYLIKKDNDKDKLYLNFIKKVEPTLTNCKESVFRIQYTYGFIKIHNIEERTVFYRPR